MSTLSLLTTERNLLAAEVRAQGKTIAEMGSTNAALNQELDIARRQRDEAMRRATEDATDYLALTEAFDASGLTVLDDDIPEALIYANSIKQAGEQWTAIVQHLELGDTDDDVPDAVLSLLARVDQGDANRAALVERVRGLAQDNHELRVALERIELASSWHHAVKIAGAALAPAAPPAPTHAVTFQLFVDAKPYTTDKPSLYGSEIKAFDNGNPIYQLFLESPGDAPDEYVGDAQVIQLEGVPTRHFYRVPPATWGAPASPPTTATEVTSDGP